MSHAEIPVLIAWYVAKLDPRIASIRLRCMLPMQAVQKLGIQVGTYNSCDRDKYKTVIFSKIYDDRALYEAQRLKTHGTRVVFDICDNHFHGEDEHHFISARVERLSRMLVIADKITTSTDVLASQMRERFPDAAAKISVIPDFLEMPVERGDLTASSRRHVSRLADFHARSPGCLKLIWFGVHGARNAPAGMRDLAQIRRTLEISSTRTPISLTIMSDSYLAYLRSVAGWSLPVTYVPWSLDRADSVLTMHDVALLPINRNPFTLAKTINRPATAMGAGLGVIANAIPSYEELRPFIWLDDWAGGLDYYSRVRPRDDPKLAAGKAYLAKVYAGENIAAMWRDVLSS
jgi:hypothetical protein